MSSLGFKTILKVTGTSTAMTAEPMSVVTANTVFQITDTTKRILDRSASFTFYEDDGAGGRIAIPSSEIKSIDYLFGKVTFTVAQTPPITVTGSYLPATAIAGAHSYELNQTADILDNTEFNGGGFRSKQPGLIDVSVSVTRWDPTDLQFFNHINNRTSFVLDIQPGGTGPNARGFFVVENENRSGDISSLESVQLSFQLDGDGAGKDFSWSDL